MRELKISKSITNRDSRSTEKFFQEMAKETLLTPDEEVVIAQRIKMGDQKALDRLIRANLRFVVSVAKQYQNQGLGLNDLINEGNVGLIVAAHRFDETKGFKFISYAVWWIRQSILKALAEDARIVQLPLNKVALSNDSAKAHLKFLQENERDPTSEELAELIGVELRDIQDAMSTSIRHKSLDEPVHEGEDLTLGDNLENGERSDTELDHHESLRIEVQMAFRRLTPRQAEVLADFFGINEKREAFSLEAIAGKYGLGRERVRQIKERAIEKLRKSRAGQRLAEYLG
ncbi:MAG: RNA polymerase sigma factor RpoD/SigA [bacterium]